MFKNSLELSTPVPQAAVDAPVPQHKSQTDSYGVTSLRISLLRSTPS
jgi:hypothetical protein